MRSRVSVEGLLLFNTINFALKAKTIDRFQIIQQLERFFQNDHLSGILIHDPADFEYVKFICKSHV